MTAQEVLDRSLSRKAFTTNDWNSLQQQQLACLNVDQQFSNSIPERLEAMGCGGWCTCCSHGLVTNADNEQQHPTRHPEPPN